MDRLHRRGGDRRSPGARSKASTDVSDRGRSADALAGWLGCSATKIDHARKVLRSGEAELIAQVEADKVPLYKAAKLVASRPQINSSRRASQTNVAARATGALLGDRQGHKAVAAKTASSEGDAGTVKMNDCRNALAHVEFARGCLLEHMPDLAASAERLIDAIRSALEGEGD